MIIILFELGAVHAVCFCCKGLGISSPGVKGEYWEEWIEGGGEKPWVKHNLGKKKLVFRNGISKVVAFLH